MNLILLSRRGPAKSNCHKLEVLRRTRIGLSCGSRVASHACALRKRSGARSATRAGVWRVQDMPPAAARDPLAARGGKPLSCASPSPFATGSASPPSQWTSSSSRQLSARRGMTSPQAKPRKLLAATPDDDPKPQRKLASAPAAANRTPPLRPTRSRGGTPQGSARTRSPITSSRSRTGDSAPAPKASTPRLGAVQSPLTPGSTSFLVVSPEKLDKEAAKATAARNKVSARAAKLTAARETRAALVMQKLARGYAERKHRGLIKQPHVYDATAKVQSPSHSAAAATGAAAATSPGSAASPHSAAAGNIARSAADIAAATPLPPPSAAEVAESWKDHRPSPLAASFTPFASTFSSPFSTSPPRRRVVGSGSSASPETSPSPRRGLSVTHLQALAVVERNLTNKRLEMMEHGAVFATGLERPSAVLATTLQTLVEEGPLRPENNAFGLSIRSDRQVVQTVILKADVERAEKSIREHSPSRRAGELSGPMIGSNAPSPSRQLDFLPPTPTVGDAAPPSEGTATEGAALAEGGAPALAAALTAAPAASPTAALAAASADGVGMPALLSTPEKINEVETPKHERVLTGKAKVLAKSAQLERAMLIQDTTKIQALIRGRSSRRKFKADLADLKKKREEVRVVAQKKEEAKAELRKKEELKQEAPLKQAELTKGDDKATAAPLSAISQTSSAVAPGGVKQ